MDADPLAGASGLYVRADVAEDLGDAGGGEVELGGDFGLGFAVGDDAVVDFEITLARLARDGALLLLLLTLGDGTTN